MPHRLPVVGRLVILSLALASAASVLAQGSGSPSNPISNRPPAAAQPQGDLPPTNTEATFDGKTMTLGGLRFDIPEGWEKQELSPSQPIRPAARFTLNPPEGVKADPAMVSFYHGIRGSPEQNIARWRNQITTPLEKPEEKTHDVNGVRVLTLVAQGTYAGGMGMTQSGPQENWAVLGAVISGPGGDVHVLARGPKDILIPQRNAWEKMVTSFVAANAKPTTESKPAAETPTSDKSTSPATIDGETVNIAGVNFTIPKEWKKQEVAADARVKPAAKYQIEAAPGSGIEHASLNFYLGLTDTPERTLALWLAQINQLQVRPKKEDRQINGMRVVSMFTQGVYSPGVGPDTGPTKENWVILGAIVCGPEANIAILARGPKEILLPAHEKWNAMINSAKPTVPMPASKEPTAPSSTPQPAKP